MQKVLGIIFVSEKTNQSSQIKCCLSVQKLILNHVEEEDEYLVVFQPPSSIFGANTEHSQKSRKPLIQKPQLSFSYLQQLKSFNDDSIGELLSRKREDNRASDFQLLYEESEGNLNYSLTNPPLVDYSSQRLVVNDQPSKRSPRKKSNRKRIRKRVGKYNKKKNPELKVLQASLRKIDTTSKFDILQKVLSSFPSFDVPGSFRIFKAKFEIGQKCKMCQRSLPYFFVNLKIIKQRELGEEFEEFLKAKIEKDLSENTRNRTEEEKKLLQETFEIIFKAVNIFLNKNQFEGMEIAFMNKPSGQRSQTKALTSLKKCQDLFLDIFSNNDNRSSDLDILGSQKPL